MYFEPGIMIKLKASPAASDAVVAELSRQGRPWPEYFLAAAEPANPAASTSSDIASRRRRVELCVADRESGDLDRGDEARVAKLTGSRDDAWQRDGR